MLIYNVTTHVEPSIEQEWLLWMKEEHLPKMILTGCFLKAKLFKVITDQDQGGLAMPHNITAIHAKNMKNILPFTQKHCGKMPLNVLGTPF